jgi:hypothetical protein
VVQFGGSVLVATDYGATTVSDVLTYVAQQNALVWNVGLWNQSNWGGSDNLQFFPTPLQIDDSSGQNISYSFAFGISSNDTNPPYRFAGVSGEYAVEGRSYSS